MLTQNLQAGKLWLKVTMDLNGTVLSFVSFFKRKTSRRFSLWYSTGLLSVFSRDGVFILNLPLKQIQARALPELVELTVSA